MKNKYVRTMKRSAVDYMLMGGFGVSKVVKTSSLWIGLGRFWFFLNRKIGLMWQMIILHFYIIILIVWKSL